MVVYNGSVQTGCGQGSSQTGPFYCSADQTVYIDLDFFKTMQQSIGASGDFCYAYVIAHEVGHHVQYLLGTLDDAHSRMSRVSEREANEISVRLELQADYYAGVWGNRDNEMFGSIEPGDVENAINAASKIGDDYLQKKAYGREMPESFNHGRSEWRVRWLSKGLKTGDPLQGDTFSIPYSQVLGDLKLSINVEWMNRCLDSSTLLIWKYEIEKINGRYLKFTKIPDLLSLLEVNCLQKADRSSSKTLL